MEDKAVSDILPVPIPKISFEEFIAYAQANKAKYSVQFVEYEENTWTAPCELTDNRKDMLLQDKSIKKIRIEIELK